MTTPAKNSCAFCPTRAHHMSVLHVLVHEMQLEALWGNRAFFLKCNYRGNRGRTWENSEELQRSAWNCGDLWRAVESLQHAVGMVGVLSASHELKMICMDDYFGSSLSDKSNLTSAVTKKLLD